MKLTLHTPERWGDFEALVNTRVWASACCWRRHHHSCSHYRESGKPASLIEGASPEARRELQRPKVRLRSRT